VVVILPADPDDLAVALQRLRGQPDAIAQVAAQLNRSTAWVEHLYRLPAPEFRRALRVVPTKLERHPHEAMYPTTGWLGEYLLHCQNSEAPLGWHFWCGVALLGLVARRNFYWDRGIYFLYLNHYVFLLGPSGLTKSTTIGRLMGVFDEMAELAKGGGLLDPVYKSPERVTPERMFKDLTDWTKNTEGRRDTVLFMVSDELATLLGKDVKGSDRLANWLTDVYLGKKRFRDFTISGGDRQLENVVVTCLFASTQNSVRRSISEALFVEGFMARTLTAPRRYEERHGSYSTPPAADPVTCYMLGEALVPWLMMDDEVEVRFTPEGAQWFDDWYIPHHDAMPDDEKLMAFWKRKADHLLKLAGVLAMSEAVAAGPKSLGGVLLVGPEVLAYACDLLVAEETRLGGAFAMIGAKEESQDTARIQSYIDKKWAETGAPVLHTTIFHNCRHIVKSGQHLREMVDALMGMDVIQLAPVGGKLAYKPKGAK